MRGAALLAFTAVAHAAPVEQPVARVGPKGFPGAPDAHHHASFIYVGYRQTPPPGATAGAGATMLQGDPALAIEDAHTLGEIGLSSADSQQIVEIGWHVDVLVNGDAHPRLFVFHWIDGAPTCYNGCGWVQVHPTLRPGMRVTPGARAVYAIELRGDDWWLSYDHQDLGYFPGSLWSTPYREVGHAQWFGEIAAASPSSCSEMGNGVFGDQPGAAVMEELFLVAPDGAHVPANAGIGTITNPADYDIGQTTPTSFAYGGPGARTGCCTPETCADLGAECGQAPDRCGALRPCGLCPDNGTCQLDRTCGPPAPPRDVTVDEGGGCCDARGGSSALPAVVVGVLLLRRRNRGSVRR